MSMFERAADAWKIQAEDERVAQEKQDRKLREEFSRLLQKITGVSDFAVRGSGEQMSAEIEGLVFVPDMRFYAVVVCMWGVLLVREGADGKRKTSGLIRTTGDLSRELERLRNSRNTPPERPNEWAENETKEPVDHALKLIG